MSKLLPILSAQALFDHCNINSQFPELQVIAGFDANIFNVLIRDPIFQFAELVQLAPASEVHHHSGPGGLLKHTLDVITLALKKRKGHTLPLGGSIAEINQQRHLWTYAIFVGCLLHDIGKLSANTRLIPITRDDEECQWTPQSGPITKLLDPLTGKPRGLKGYRIDFRKTPYRLHEHLALTHWSIIPQKGRTWLIEATHIMSELTAWLWGDKFECGSIGQIIEHADRESTARNLQIPADHRFSNIIPAIERYLKLIRTWIQDGSIRVNSNGGMGWVDENGFIYLVCRSLAEKIIQECNSLGLTNLPQDPVRVYDILQEHGYAISTEDGKAIWTIGVRTASFAHKFTCLKFDSRKLLPPSRVINPLKGEIVILDAGQELENPLPQPVIETSANIQEEPPPPENTPDKNIPDTVFELYPASDTARPDTQDTASIRSEETDDHLQETGNNPEASDQPQETAAASSDAASNQAFKNIQVISNLDFEAPDTAQKFLYWLQRGLLEKTIVINNPASEVHIVEEGVFLLAPAIFKTFLRLHDIPENKHKNLSKRFSSLRKHIRNGDVNIHSYWVQSTSRASRIAGWLLPFNAIYENDYPVPKPNKYIKRNLGGENHS